MSLLYRHLVILLSGVRILDLTRRVVILFVLNVPFFAIICTANSFENNQLSIHKWGFEENKSQITGKDASKVHFVFQDTSGLKIFLTAQGLVYQFENHQPSKGYLSDSTLTANELEANNKQEQLFETHRVDFEFMGCNNQALVSTHGKSADYVNYYKHNALLVRSFEKVIYHDIYPGIDWVIYNNKGKVKYDFIVNPGANPNQIKIRINHAKDVFLDNQGNLNIQTALGTIQEQHPISFQEDQSIATHFKLQENTLSFILSKFNKDKVLTIDPSVVWSNCYGGSLDDESFSVRTDASGNVYMSGYTSSTSGIASGGHQNSNAGDVDCFLVKFDASGIRQWATYYGGTSFESNGVCTIDLNGNVYLAGSTNSSTGIASGGHQNSKGTGLYTAFLVKFDASGTRLWATYYGTAGSIGTIGLSCITNSAGDVYLSGTTDSNAGIASGGHRNAFGTLTYESFLVKFNSSGTRQWATYYGGFSGSTIYDSKCVVDASDNVYLSGTTSASSGISSSGHQAALGGVVDAYLVKFNNAGTRQWGTYYGGSATDLGNNCTTDASGNVYLCGQTNSTASISSSGHQNGFGGNKDAFLVKFDNTGVRQWGTYYGAYSEDGAAACTTDADENVYICGYAGYSATDSIAFKALQIFCRGGSAAGGSHRDGFFAKFTSSGTRQWGTYYGGNWHDQYFDCTIDAFSGALYLCGTTFSNKFIIANQPANYGNGGAGFAAMITKIIDCPTAGVLEVPSTAFCESQTTKLIGNDAAGSFSLLSGSGSLSATTHLPLSTSNTYYPHVGPGQYYSLLFDNLGKGSLSQATYTPANISNEETVVARFTIPATTWCPVSYADATLSVYADPISSLLPVGNTVVTTPGCTYNTQVDPFDKSKKLIAFNANGNSFNAATGTCTVTNAFAGTLPSGVTTHTVGSTGYYQISDGTNSMRISRRMYSVQIAGTYPTNGGVKVRVYLDDQDTMNIQTDAFPVGSLSNFGWFKSTYHTAQEVVNNMQASYPTLSSAYEIPSVTYGTENGIRYAEFKVQNFSTFGFFAKTQAGLLPVELNSFEGVCTENQAALHWQTASEKNSDLFTIERSKDTEFWEFIGQKEGAGNSNQLISYQYTDKNPLEEAYYRLKLTDFDGKFEYSPTIYITCEQRDNLKPLIYPNPSNGFITIQIKKEQGPYHFMLQNLHGQSMFWRLGLSQEQEKIELPKMAPGVYLYQLQNKEGITLYQDKLLIE